MRRPVFAVTHGVVREDEDGRQFHQGGEPDRSAGIIAEDEEGGAESAQLRERHSVHDRGHGVLANAEVHVLASGCFGLQVARAWEGEGGLIGWREIARTSEEPGDVPVSYTHLTLPTKR